MSKKLGNNKLSRQLDRWNLTHPSCQPQIESAFTPSQSPFSYDGTRRRLLQTAPKKPTADETSEEAAVEADLDDIFALKEEKKNSAEGFSWWKIRFRFTSNYLWQNSRLGASRQATGQCCTASVALHTNRKPLLLPGLIGSLKNLTCLLCMSSAESSSNYFPSLFIDGPPLYKPFPWAPHQMDTWNKPTDGACQVKASCPIITLDWKQLEFSCHPLYFCYLISTLMMNYTISKFVLGVRVASMRGWWTNTDWQREKERGIARPPTAGAHRQWLRSPSSPRSNMAKLFDIIQPPSPSSSAASSPSSSSLTPPSLSPPPSSSPSSPVPWWPGRMEKLSASLSEITWSPLALPLDAVVSKFRLPTLVRLAHGKTRRLAGIPTSSATLQTFPTDDVFLWNC